MKRLNFYMLFLCLSFIEFSLQCSPGVVLEGESGIDSNLNDPSKSSTEVAPKYVKVDPLKEQQSPAPSSSFIPQSVIDFFQSIGRSAQEVASSFAKMTSKGISAIKTYLASVRNSFNSGDVDQIDAALDTKDGNAVVNAIGKSNLSKPVVNGLVKLISESGDENPSVASTGEIDLSGSRDTSIQMPVASEVLSINPLSSPAIALKGKVIEQMKASNALGQNPIYTQEDFEAVQSGRQTIDTANLDIATYSYTDSNGRIIEYSVDTNTGKVLSSSRIYQPAVDMGSSSLSEGKDLQALSSDSVGDESRLLNKEEQDLFNSVANSGKKLNDSKKQYCQNIIINYKKIGLSFKQAEIFVKNVKLLEPNDRIEINKMINDCVVHNMKLNETQIESIERLYVTRFNEKKSA